MPDFESDREIDLSIIVPVLNDAECLQGLLEQLKEFPGEVIVADGGSIDETVHIAESNGARLVSCEAGRAKQMNAGAAAATGKVYLFLHADSVLPQHFASLIAGAMRGAKYHWGRFDVRLSGHAPILRIVEFMMNIRSAYTGICTGDQGIFVKAEIFHRLGGFPEIELMEDIAFSKKMPRFPYRIRQQLVTSSRRWEQNGVLPTIGLMWLLRLRYFFGADPKILARYYRQAR
ncbi:MAG: TIGR04283 family arsenosugar biosynthesis glycosyltransferase [Pseudomonadales bacterium]